MHPTPYLFFPGTCREAMELYAGIFGAEIAAMSPFSELPPSEEFAVPPGMEERIMHAALRWSDGGTLMASDTVEEAPGPMAAVSIAMDLPTVAAAHAAFERMAEGGTTPMPFGPTFWSPGFGTVTDRFGTR